MVVRISWGRRRLGVSVAGMLLVAALGVIVWRTFPAPASKPIGAGRSLTDAGPYEMTPVMPSALPAPLARGIRATILVEPENVRRSRPGAYEAAVRTWRETLLAIGVQLVRPGDADVLILPEATCLGPVQRRLVKTHLARGRGVITTGAVGAYDGVCTPLRDTLVASLLGIGHGGIRPAPRRVDGTHSAVLLGESVLGAHMPPGPRIEFRPAGQIVFRNSAREMLYCDARRVPMNDGEAFYDAAALRAAVGPGRVVAFGFSPNDLVGEWSVDIGRIVISNAVHWAAGHAVFQLAPWPAGKQAAAILAIEVDDDTTSARHALDARAASGLPGTAFLAGSLATLDPVVTRRLVDSFEIGSTVQRYLPPDTLTTARQLEELAHAKRVAERVAGRPVAGFRAPAAHFTRATLQSWADLGGRYVVAGTNGRAAGPEILPLLPDSLVLLERGPDDGDAIPDRSDLRDRDAISQRLLAHVEESIAYRGLHLFSFHANMLAQQHSAQVLQELAAMLRRTPEIWTATAGEVAEWWRGRAAIALTPAPDGRSVTLVNHGPHEFTGGRLVIDAPAGARQFVRLPAIPPHATLHVDAQGHVATGASPGAQRRAAAR